MRVQSSGDGLLLPDPASRSLEQFAEATGEKRLDRLSLWIPAERGGANTLLPLSQISQVIATCFSATIDHRSAQWSVVCPDHFALECV